MTEQDIKNKNLVLVDYLDSIVNGYKVKAEYSTNDKDVEVIVVQETSGPKIIFYGDAAPIYNYYNIDIYGDNIQRAKNTSVDIGNLIGRNIYYEWNGEKWQILVKQYSNPRTILYDDIRRVSYTCTMQCIVNRIS